MWKIVSCWKEKGCFFSPNFNIAPAENPTKQVIYRIVCMYAIFLSVQQVVPQCLWSDQRSPCAAHKHSLICYYLKKEWAGLYGTLFVAETVLVLLYYSNIVFIFGYTKLLTFLDKFQIIFLISLISNLHINHVMIIHMLSFAYHKKNKKQKTNSQCPFL